MVAKPVGELPAMLRLCGSHQEYRLPPPSHLQAPEGFQSGSSGTLLQVSGCTSVVCSQNVVFQLNDLAACDGRFAVDGACQLSDPAQPIALNDPVARGGSLCRPAVQRHCQALGGGWEAL